MGYGQGLTIFVLVATASMLVVNCIAKTIAVGGTEGWHYGFNYAEWARTNGPFHLNDTLVFKYDPPNSTTFPHNVYLLENFQSYLNCNLTGATLVGNETVGGGNGLQFVINDYKRYYFACGEKNGLHCQEGMMKFTFIPLSVDHDETHG